MSDDFRWEEPPPRVRGGVHDWAAIAEALKARPQEWAMVAVLNNSVNAGSTARHIREGNYAALASGFDAVARTVDGEARIYARFMGDAS